LGLATSFRFTLIIYCITTEAHSYKFEYENLNSRTFICVFPCSVSAPRSFAPSSGQYAPWPRQLNHRTTEPQPDSLPPTHTSTHPQTAGALLYMPHTPHVMKPTAHRGRSLQPLQSPQTF